MPDLRTLKFYQADVFTGVPFGGNPVAVFPNAQGLNDFELQQIAREMNLSETVFVFPPTEQGGSRPAADLHPDAGDSICRTSGARHLFRPGPARHDCGQGWHDARMQECNIGLFLWSSMPEGRYACRDDAAKAGILGPVEDTDDFYKVAKHWDCPNIDCRDEVAGRGGVDRPAGLDRAGAHADGGTVDLAGRVRDYRDVRAVRRQRNHGLHDDDCGANATVHTRMFAPAIGILEDPATGSASGAMGAYLVQNGLVEVGPMTEIVVEQGYEIGRPSRILVQVESDDDAIQR